MQILALLLLIIALILLPRLTMVSLAGKRTYSAEEAPPTRVAIVFGAGLTSSGAPTTVLKDRITTAVDLYQAGKVEKILMSGDNRFIYYNEPGAMKSFALELGVQEEDIVLDFAGRRTYDTCYRAKEIFALDQAILVTQNFHLARALYTCNTLGLDSVGVEADLRPYRDERFWKIREIPACLNAFIMTNLTRPEPVLGEVEPIFPVE
jgi:SanA protein